jgi:hypothetical protein
MTANAQRTAAEASPAKEAERAATRSAARPGGWLLQRRCACGAGAGSGGECESCARPALQRKGSDTAQAGHDAWPASVSATLARPGRALDADTRSFMEDRYGGHDFSAVRVHDDAAAAASARDVDAHAYTVGSSIVFGAGQYQPGTESGRHLLAHELAHTVQQQGLQRAGTTALADHGSEYRRLEGEADRAADAVMRGAPAPLLSVDLSPGGPRLSRKPSGAAPAQGKGEDHTIESRYRDVEMETQHKVTPEKTAKGKGSDKDKTLASFEVDRLDLHEGKGPVIGLWKQKAAAGGLRAVITMQGGKAQEAGLWQLRSNPDELRARWLNRKGWKAGDALNQAWQKAGGDAEFPKAAGGTCEMDHIVELQVGGDNTQENIQVLDRTENGMSGSLLKQQSFGLAQSIVKNISEAGEETPSQVRLVFKSAHMPAAATCGPCCKAANALKAPTTADGKADKGSALLIEYPLTAGGSTVTLRVSDDAKPASIYESDVPVNKASAEIIPGLLLMTLHRAGPGKAKGGDTVSAVLDTRDKTRLPINLPAKGTPVKLAVSEGRELKLGDDAKKDAGIAFTYDYLSPGRFTKLELVPGGVAAEGYITTDELPFVKRFEVSYAPDHFRIKAPLDKSQLQPPFPGVKVTEASLALDLAPKLKPVGSIAFEFGTARKLASARVDVSANDAGVTLDGELLAFLPGVDEAKGTVKYAAGEWSGGVHIDASQMARKLPMVQSGSVDVFLKAGKLGASGSVDLALPGGNKAQVTLRYAASGWTFTGKGRIDTRNRYLKPIDADLFYDGVVFRARGETGFVFAGMDGTVVALYEHEEGRERVSGKGKLKIDKGRAKGNLDVELLPSQKVKGTGKVSYEIKKDLIATAGVTIDEQQKITFDGEVGFPDITLFKRIPEREEPHTIFAASGSFPIPGASLGPLGLKVKLWGELGWYYYVGPGVLTGVKANVRFSPLEENPDFSFKLTAKASIPAGGGITGKVGADAVLDAVIAEAGAGLSVEARAGLEGKAELAAEINYAKDRFSVDADASIGGAVVLDAALKARVYAEAGVWRFKVRSEKVWTLAGGHFDTGLKLGLKLPLHYDSVEGFRMPKLADVKREPEKLDIDAARMFGKLADDTTPVEKEL